MEPTNPRIGSSLDEFMRVESEDFDDGYIAGLRRAQELAKEHVYLQCDGGKCGECAPDACVMFDDFDQAIAAEVAKR